MKRTIAIMTALLMTLVCMAPAALAEDPETLSMQMSRDVKTKVITLSGTYQNGYGKMMTVVAQVQELTEEDNNAPGPAVGDSVYLNQFFITDEAGAYSHAFRIPDESPIGTYLITVTAADTGAQAEKTLEHVGEAAQLAAVKRLRDAVNGAATAAEAAVAAGSVIQADRAALMLDLTDYQALGARGARVNELVAAGVKQNQPQDVIAVFDIFQPAMAIASLEGCGVQNARAVLEKYNEVFGVDLAQLDVLNENAKAYAMDQLQKGTYASPAGAANGYTDSLILGIVSKPQNYTEIRQALLVTYKDHVKLDTGRFSQVKDQSEVFKAMLDVNYQSLDQVKTAFNQAVENRLKAESGGGGSFGGGGGGGGTPVGGGTSGLPAIPGQTENPAGPEDPNPPQDQTAFSDLGDAQWAQDAVKTLYDKGIIKASQDGKFRPGDSITRAEFLALIVRAFGLEANETGASFGDVSADDWYYDVVMAAAASGIVQGAGGMFAPDAEISRQDMAVMIDRAAKQKQMTFGAAQSPASFSDMDQIADYAAEAVESMRRAGIINGNGDGTFAPLASATRAESAKIIAAVITSGR